MSRPHESPIWAALGPSGHRIHADDEIDVGDGNDFLDTVSARGLSPATVRAYAYDLVALYRWMHDAKVVLRELDAARLIEFVVSQQRAGAQPKSINRRLTTCEQLYRFATGSPLSQARLATGGHYAGRGREHALGLHRRKRVERRKLRVKAPRKLVEPLTVDQVSLLLHRLTRYRDLAIVHLMLLAGLRSAELLALRIGDVEWNAARVRVRGKGNRERMLPLADVVTRVLADYLRLERPKDAHSEKLFLVLQGRRRGAPMTAEGLRSLFRHRRTTSPSLAQANAHRLRHTFGADMARAGVRLPILQRMMGHADGKTTLQYINLSMDDVAAEYAYAIASIEKRYERKP
ncbi:MAG TPA: tyrosine-type recombinase/integrase [Steroidobacteraceae bacterium]|nr:tyrosine-type recombinase/integrase [Steroidobacteraceae bacterium]